MNYDTRCCLFGCCSRYCSRCDTLIIIRSRVPGRSHHVPLDFAICVIPVGCSRFTWFIVVVDASQHSLCPVVVTFNSEFRYASVYTCYFLYTLHAPLPYLPVLPGEGRYTPVCYNSTVIPDLTVLHYTRLLRDTLVTIRC